MKFFYIVVLIGILGGIFYFLADSTTKSDSNVPAEVSEELEPSEQSEPDTTVNETDTNNVEDTSSLEVGGDVGMEFPVVEDESILESKNFDVNGFNFGYDVTEIRVKEGDTVTINLSVSDGFHDWVVDEFAAATEKIREGGLTSVTFVADKAGTYEYYCSVGQHRANGMVGTLIVE